MKKNKIYKIANINEFSNHFVNENDCYEYLSCLKWSGQNFICKKCGNTHYCKGHLPFSRRCTRCKYDESPLTGTSFERNKIPLIVAFRILFDICINENEISSNVLSEKYKLRQKTIWDYKHKIHLSLKKARIIPLNGKVIISEYCVRDTIFHQTENLVIVGLEILEDGNEGRAYAQLIDIPSSDSIQQFCKNYISRKAEIIICNKREKQPFLNPNRIEKKENYSLEYNKKIQDHIETLKSWFYVVHRHCSYKYIQDYLNEYYFRFNNRKTKDLLFYNLIYLLVKNQK